MSKVKTVFEARSWAKTRKRPTEGTRGQNYGLRHQKWQEVVGVSEVTPSQGVSRWEVLQVFWIHLSVNTSRCVVIIVFLWPPLWRVWKDVGPLSRELEVCACAVGVGVERDVLKDSQFRWSRVGSRYRSKWSRRGLDTLPVGAPEMLFKHRIDLSMIALRNISW